MQDTIKIGNTDVLLDNSAAWTMEYRDQFGEDILPVIMPLISSMMETAASIAGESDGNELKVGDILAAIEGRSTEVFLPLYTAEFNKLVINVLWSMAKAANEDIDPPKKWIRQFDVFPLDEIIPKVYKLAFKGLVSSKNLKRLRNMARSLKVTQPLNSMTLSSEESKEA